MARPAKEPSIQDEVLGNIRAQPIGDCTVADLGLPVEFLRRVADRVIRDSFMERFRMVVREPGGPASEPVDRAGGPARRVRIVRGAVGAGVVTARVGIPEGRPALRGYRAVPGDAIPVAVEPDGGLAGAAQVVGRRLAVDGLLLTAAAVIETLGPHRFQADGDVLSALQGAGLPVDLLGCFSDDGRSETLVVELARRLASGARAASMRKELASRPFRFAPSVGGFRVFTESGEHEAGVLRVQITGGAYWGGRGAGGSLDLLRELLGAAPTCRVIASIEEKHLEGLLRLSGDWPAGAESRVTVVAEPLPVSQWAQDNGKAGEAGGEAVTLGPRYASRGEDGAVLVPGETFLVDGLAAAGLRVARSSLLFQGGNLLAVREPASDQRVMLVGEAEVHRNVTLGLTPEQAIEALRVEFGVDRCVVLPAASFHIDTEVTVRAAGGGVTAFVPDTEGAAKMVLELGIGALERAGTLDAGEARRTIELLRMGRLREVLSALSPAMARAAVGPGQFPERLGAAFAAGPGDFGPANFQVFLLALDVLGAAMGTAAADPNLSTYYGAFRRRDADRRVLHRRLEERGWRLVRVPTFAEGVRAPSAINGIHEAHRYLMPAWGGFFSPLDQAASGAFSAALGPGVKVVPIACAESQRRGGGVHCSVSALPAGFGL